MEFEKTRERLTNELSAEREKNTTFEKEHARELQQKQDEVTKLTRELKRVNEKNKRLLEEKNRELEEIAARTGYRPNKGVSSPNMAGRSSSNRRGDGGGSNDSATANGGLSSSGVEQFL